MPASRSRSLALVLSLVVQHARATAGCDDTCEHAGDAICNDGGPGSVYYDCERGTDCSDCGGPSSPPPPGHQQPTAGCQDTCEHAGDGLCNDGGPGAVYYDCALGTDCTDCGARDESSIPLSSPPPSPQQPSVEAAADLGASPSDKIQNEAAAALKASPLFEALQQMTVGVIAVGIVATLACCTLCTFVWIVRSRERKGDPIFKPNLASSSSTRLPKEVAVEVPVTQDDVEMVNAREGL